MLLIRTNKVCLLLITALTVTNVMSNEADDFMLDKSVEYHCQVYAGLYNSCFGWDQYQCKDNIMPVFIACDQNSGNYPPTGTTQAAQDAFKSCVNSRLENMLTGIDLDAPCN